MSLQSSTLRIVKAYQSVTTEIDTLEGWNLNVQHNHQLWYYKAVRVASTIGIEPVKKSNCFFQTHSENVPADNICDFYHRSIIIPVQNEVVEDLRRQFNPDNISFINGFYCVPKIMDKYQNKWESNVLYFMKTYEEDMPNPESCIVELECCKTLWANDVKGGAPETLEDALSRIKPLIYPNITCLLTLPGTVPVTTCTCDCCIQLCEAWKKNFRNQCNKPDSMTWPPYHFMAAYQYVRMIFLIVLSSNIQSQSVWQIS